MHLCQTYSLHKAYKNLKYAQNLLLNPHLNNRYRIISYLRLCCLAIQRCRATGVDLAPELDAKRPYLALLENFYQHDPFWVSRCSISSGGTASSSDPWINRHLEIVQRCSIQIALNARLNLDANIFA